MPQTVLGFRVAVLGPFREAVGVFRARESFWCLIFEISSSGVSLLRSTDVNASKNTGTTKKRDAVTEW